MTHKATVTMGRSKATVPCSGPINFIDVLSEAFSMVATLHNVVLTDTESLTFDIVFSLSDSKTWMYAVVSIEEVDG